MADFQKIFTFRNVLLGLIVAFAILTYFAKTYPYFPFDLSLTKSIQLLRIPLFDFLMKLLSNLGGLGAGSIITIAFALAVFYLKEWRSAVVLIASAFGSLLISQTLKDLVGRSRPDPALVFQVGKFLKPDSFPSGHVLFAMGLYGFLLYLTFVGLKKSLLRTGLLIAFGLIIFLMAISRIYLGAHWFSDTLGSYLIGTVWLLIVVKIHKRIMAGRSFSSFLTFGK